MKKIFSVLFNPALFLVIAFATMGSSCFRKNSSPPPPVAALPPKAVLRAEKKVAPKDQELQRLARYLEQADAVHREAWWVVANERKSPGRSIFGKAQRALQSELNQKLSNKAVFSCDKYLVRREISSATGLPQKGEIFEKCSARSEAVRFAEFDLHSKTEADIFFYPQNLNDVVGSVTAIMNHKIHCRLVGDEEGKLKQNKCENMAQDRSPTQSIQFLVYDYEKEGKNLITLKGQVFESLAAIRKIEAEVPMSGKILVTETQTQAPEATPPPAPAVQATMPADGIPTAVERGGRHGGRAAAPNPADHEADVAKEAAASAKERAEQQAKNPQGRSLQPRGAPVPNPNSGEITEGQAAGEPGADATAVPNAAGTVNEDPSGPANDPAIAPAPGNVSGEAPGAEGRVEGTVEGATESVNEVIDPATGLPVPAANPAPAENSPPRPPPLQLPSAR